MKNLITMFLFTVVTGFTTPAQENKGLTAAINDDDLEAVQAAVKKGADINLKNEEGANPLMLAISKDYRDVAEWLLQQPGIDVKTSDKEGNNVLHYLAASEECLDLTPTLIKMGVPVNAPNSEKATPVVVAVNEKNAPAVKLLFENGADMNIKDEEEGTTLFEYAIEQDKEEIIEAFIYAKPSPEIAQIILCYTENTEIITKAVALGADVNKALCDEEDGVNPLMQALYDDEVEIVKALLANGANVNMKDGKGTPAFFYAEKECLALVLDKKPDMSLTDAEGRSFLQELIDGYLFVINNTTLDEIQLYFDKGFTAPKTLSGKPVFKYIDEQKLQVPEKVKMTDESRAGFEQRLSKQKEELKKYLKSKGVK